MAFIIREERQPSFWETLLYSLGQGIGETGSNLMNYYLNKKMYETRAQQEQKQWEERQKLLAQEKQEEEKRQQDWERELFKMQEEANTLKTVFQNFSKGSKETLYTKEVYNLVSNRYPNLVKAIYGDLDPQNLLSMDEALQKIKEDEMNEEISRYKKFQEAKARIERFNGKGTSESSKYYSSLVDQAFKNYQYRTRAIDEQLNSTVEKFMMTKVPSHLWLYVLNPEIQLGEELTPKQREMIAGFRKDITGITNYYNTLRKQVDEGYKKDIDHIMAFLGDRPSAPPPSTPPGPGPGGLKVKAFPEGKVVSKEEELDANEITKFKELDKNLIPQFEKLYPSWKKTGESFKAFVMRVVKDDPRIQRGLSKMGLSIDKYIKYLGAVLLERE